MFDYDDEELDKLEDRAHHGKNVDDAVAGATIEREEIRLKQQVDPIKLTIIRDLLLAGRDVDAIGILCHELGLEAPRKVDTVQLAAGSTFSLKIDGVHAYFQNTHAEPVLIRPVLTVTRIPKR